MAHFRFVTLWELATTREAVWEALVDYAQVPHWWSFVKSVTAMAPGDATGLGQCSHFQWSTPLGYGLDFETTVTEIAPPAILVTQAKGQVVGEGRWELTPTAQGTEVVYFWTVATTQRWMDWMAVAMRPLMEWNHDVIMRQGGQSLANYLGCEILRNEALKPEERSSKASILSP